MTRLQMIITISAVVILMIIGGLLLVFFSKQVISARSVAIQSITVKPDSINIQAHILDSAILYKSYTAVYKNGVLEITVFGGLFSKSKTGDVEISIPNTYKEIKKVMLVGKNREDIAVAWQLPN
jgi:hypothetical protein